MCITKLMIRRALRHHQAGNVDALLKFDAKDVRFVFPGNNSWPGEFHRKDAIAAWLQRFHRAGLKMEPHEVVVGGPPWNLTVCIRITDYAKDSNGNDIYHNRAVLFGKVHWGKIFSTKSMKTLRRSELWTNTWRHLRGVPPFVHK